MSDHAGKGDRQIEPGNQALFAKYPDDKFRALVEEMRKYAVVMQVVTLADGTVISGQARQSSV